MSKSKHTALWKIEIVKKYLSGEGSYARLSEAYGVGEKTLKDWVCRYREQGELGFMPRTGNTHYSKAFKIKCVEEVLCGNGSVDDIVAKNNISDRSVLRRWILRYNDNQELKDYNPKREVYMADARRRITQEEHKEIVEYCIAHDKDYKGTATLYDVSYSQVYRWEKKYLADGEGSLEDKRGRHKTDDEVDEVERFRRENLRLKCRLEERDMMVELLKKVKESERM